MNILEPSTPEEPKLIHASLARQITGKEKIRIEKENIVNKRNEIVELINKAIHDGRYKIGYCLSIPNKIIEELYMYGYDITKETDNHMSSWIISWEGEEK